VTRNGTENRDDLLIAALSTGATQEAAAAAAHVSRRTLNRRLSDPDFRSRLESARRAIFERAADRAAGIAAEALDTLAALLGETEPPAVRLGAARALLDTATRLRETVTLADRLAAVEKLLGTGRRSSLGVRDPEGRPPDGNGG
jgi:hypothetical protein